MNEGKPFGFTHRTPYRSVFLSGRTLLVAVLSLVALSAVVSVIFHSILLRVAIVACVLVLMATRRRHRPPPNNPEGPAGVPVLVGPVPPARSASADIPDSEL